MTREVIGIISVGQTLVDARGSRLGDDNVIGAFSEADAARLSGLSVGQLRGWDRRDFLKPSYAEPDRSLPYSRIYSFRDIVSLRVLGQLRNVYKVTMQHLGKVSKKLEHLGDAKWSAATLYVLGRRVVFHKALGVIDGLSLCKFQQPGGQLIDY